MAKPNKEQELMGTLLRKGVPNAATVTEAPPVQVPEPKKGKMGKPVQFWMHDGDKQILREASAWLAGQGIRTTDSMVVRAALRVAVQNLPQLLQAYREASQLDGRYRSGS